MDRIKLLPDHIANQIAAGEVVQRPASVIKELMENSVDSGATAIKVIIKDAGSSLIQVIDNGCGMSVTDARMCWERHATSKIKKADDLFQIKSFGFRGEALASIAAISHVDMKTKRFDDEIGTYIKIEGSKVIEQTPISCADGTQFSVKNLFYNVPARRQFLKSASVEMKHIIDEFIRVALPHPNLSFALFNDEKEVFDLKPESQENRFINLVSKQLKNELLNISESHDLVNISGFVGTPKSAKRTRGEQFMFVNNRYVKEPYFYHAIINAYDTLISKEQFPSYCLFFEINPAKIDVNIHPTKTELKFEDDKLIYSLLKSAVKKVLGQFHQTPEIDFNHFNFENNSENLATFANKNNFQVKNEKTDFVPFEQVKWKSSDLKNWKNLFEIPDKDFSFNNTFNPAKNELPFEIKSTVNIKHFFSIQNGIIVAFVDDKLLLIDQRAAHEKVLYQKYLNQFSQTQINIQKLAFPKTIELSSHHYLYIHNLFEELLKLGFDLADFGNNCIIINGLPTDLERGNEKQWIENFIENHQQIYPDNQLNQNEKLALSMAQSHAIYRTNFIENQQVSELLKQLFLSSNPRYRPNGKPIFIEINQEIITQLFKK